MTMIFDPAKDKRVRAKGFEVKGNSTFDKDGQLYIQKYVEYTVIGKNSEYQSYMLLDEFEKHNPKIRLGNKG